jgi:hypothetical protein
MVFKNEMWIRPTVGVVNAARTHRRGPIYRAHAPAPFMGEGSPTIF